MIKMRGAFSRRQLRMAAIAALAAFIFGGVLIVSLEWIAYLTERRKASEYLFTWSAALGNYIGGGQLTPSLTRALEAAAVDGYAAQLLESSGTGYTLLWQNEIPLGLYYLEALLDAQGRFVVRISPELGWIDWRSFSLSALALFALCSLVAFGAYFICDYPVRHLTAQADPKSGLYPGAVGERLIKHLLSQDGRSKNVLALFDVDNFAQVNEQAGRAAADDYLNQSFCRLNAELNGAQDIACRMKGDMVLVFFPCGDEEYLPIRLDRMRAAFSGNLPTLAGASIDMHASAGVAVSPENGKNFQTLYEKADIALYCSKRDGKNRLSYYVEAPERIAV